MQIKSLFDISLIAIICGTLGYALGHYMNDRNANVFSKSPTPVVAENIMSIEAAKLQRSEGYKNINTLSEILSLPSQFSQKEALHTIAGRSNKVQLLLLIKESNGMANINQRNHMVNVLVMRLSELDPNRAVEIAIEAYENRNYTLLSDVFMNLATLDLQAAIDRANEIEKQYQHETAAQGILQAIPAEDVALQIDISNQLGLKSKDEQFVSNALIAKAQQDPEDAMQEAMLMPKGYERESTLLSIIDSWANDNPDQAFAFTNQITDKVIQQRMRESVLYRWSEADPQKAYEVMSTLPRNSIVNVNFTVFSNLANENPREAINLIENIPSSRQRSDAYTAAITSWAAKDAQAAANYVSLLDNKQLRNQLAGTIIHSLSQQSPEDALSWAQEIDPNGQLYLHDTVIGQIASNDPQRALQLAQETQKDSLRKQLSLTVVNNISYNDPIAASEIIDQLPTTDVTDELVSTVVYAWANTDPDAAIAWLNSKSGSLRENGLISLGSQLANVDPDMAASYLPQLNGKVRESWVENITYYYSSYDLAQGATWVENFRGEAMYGKLLSALISNAASTDTDYALQLAQNAPTLEIRNTMIRQIADQVSYSDPQRAELLYSRLPAEDASAEIAYQ